MPTLGHDMDSRYSPRLRSAFATALAGAFSKNERSRFALDVPLPSKRPDTEVSIFNSSKKKSAKVRSLKRARNQYP